jgi:hypothetical protein
MFERNICDKLMLKLPGPLEKEIREKWEEYRRSNNLDTIPNSEKILSDIIGIRCQFIIEKLKEKCTYIQIQK